jgi:hypothetical protein
VIPDLGAGQQRGGIPEVCPDGDAAAGAGEHGLAMQDHDRVIVGVGDSRIRAGFGGHLVKRALGGQAGADVQELPDARLGGQVPGGHPQEGAVGQRLSPGLRDQSHDLLGSCPVSGEIVLAAEVVVIHPRHVGNRCVHPLGKTA